MSFKKRRNETNIIFSKKCLKDNKKSGIIILKITIIPLLKKGDLNMKERIFNKDQYINEELKKANVRREDFDRWVNILKEEYERENGR